MLPYEGSRLSCIRSMFRIRTPQISRTKFRNLIISWKEESATLSMLLHYSLATFSSRKTIIYAHVENQSPTPQPQVMFLRFTALGSFRGLARGRRDLHPRRQFQSLDSSFSFRPPTACSALLSWSIHEQAYCRHCPPPLPKQLSSLLPQDRLPEDAALPPVKATVPD